MTRSSKHRTRWLLAVLAIAATSCGSGSPVSVGEGTSGAPCSPGPSASAGVDESIDPDRRGEALVLHLTGIDEMVEQEENEGVEIIYDDPNYGGVWGDRAGGWIVAVVDCSKVDPDRIAQIAGGPASVQLIEVAHSFEEVNQFRDRLSDELRDAGIAGLVPIDSTSTGRHIRVVVEDPNQLPEDFGRDVPSDAFSIEAGEPGGEEPVENNTHPFDDPDLAGLCVDEISDFAEGEPSPFTTEAEAIAGSIREGSIPDYFDVGDGEIRFRGNRVGSYSLIDLPEGTVAIETTEWCFPDR